MKRLILALAAMVISLSSVPCQAQNAVKVCGSTQLNAPATSSNPLAVTVAGSSGGSVAVTSVPQPTGTTLANTTSINGTVGGTAATVTLTAPATSVSILNTSANILYIAFTGTATNANMGLPAGVGYTYASATPVSTFSVIGSGSGTTYGVISH